MTKPMIETVKDIKHCGDCRHARPDQNLDDDLRICREGYGIKHVLAKACKIWETDKIDTKVI